VPVRRIAFVSLCAAVILGGIVARVAVDGERELALSTAALKDGDVHDAIVHARRAAGWYLPGAPHVRVARARLVAIARAAEERNQHDVALMSWRALRTSLFESRALVVPARAEFALANREIARLSARAPGSADPDPALLAAHLSALERDEAPRPVWSLALALACVLGVASFRAATAAAASAAGRVEWRRAPHAVILHLAAVGLWLLAVWRA
jgi:hypothetical protein